MNIKETKKSSTNNINCFDNDKIIEGKLMYENPKIKFPKKKIPSNDQIFVKPKVTYSKSKITYSKPKVTYSKKTYSKKTSKKLKQIQV